MKRKLFLILSFSYLNNSWSFTLMTNTAAAFSEKEVKFYITSNSDCANTGISKEEILSIALDSANDFWNTVPSSTLRLKKGGTLTTSDPLYLNGELCAADSEVSCDINTTVPVGDDIIISCNDNSINFPVSTILALSAPTNTSGSKISGSTILINNTLGSDFSNLSYHEKRSLLAHELGHAIGLGHSTRNEALMYYKNAKHMNRLSQDDIDGVTYLYPNKLDGCGSFFGTLHLDRREPPIKGSPFITSITSGFGTFVFLGMISKFLLYFIRRIRQYLRV